VPTTSTRTCGSAVLPVLDASACAGISIGHVRTSRMVSHHQTRLRLYTVRQGAQPFLDYVQPRSATTHRHPNFHFPTYLLFSSHWELTQQQESRAQGQQTIGQEYLSGRFSRHICLPCNVVQKPRALAPCRACASPPDFSPGSALASSCRPRPCVNRSGREGSFMGRNL
jgi:hypothetical protein